MEHRFLSPPRLWDVLVVLIVAVGVYAMSCRVREQESRMVRFGLILEQQSAAISVLYSVVEGLQEKR